MSVRDLKSFVPTAEELLALDLAKLGEILLIHLNSWKGEGKVCQQAGLNRLYFVQVMEGTERGLGPARRNQAEYGAQQPAVTRRMLEAWNWLERQGYLMHDPDQALGDWFLITNEGEELLKRKILYEQLETLGIDRVKSELNKERPRIGTVGGGSNQITWAWEWLRAKENKPPLKPVNPGEWVLISETRLDEVRALKSPQFDFRKLVRICEELNIASREECHFSTAMLTRGLLDHVPPIFGSRTFAEVANNYPGGTRSFKDTMHQLETAARKVADAHLHTPIRKSETLPVAQQVNFASQLDVLLSEIVRITW